MANTLGSRIKQLRLKHAPKPYRLTLQGLAEMARTTKGYLWELENDKTKHPGAWIIYRIAKALNTTMEYLLTGEES